MTTGSTQENHLEKLFAQALQNKLQGSQALDLRKVAKKANNEDTKQEIESLADQFGDNITSSNIVQFTRKIKTIGGNPNQLDLAVSNTSSSNKARIEADVINTFVEKNDKTKLNPSDLANPFLTLTTTQIFEDSLISGNTSVIINIHQNQARSALSGIDLSLSSSNNLIDLAQEIIEKASQIQDPSMEGEVLVSNAQKALNKRFLQFDLYGMHNVLIPNYADIPVIQSFLSLITAAASNYLGEVISTAPKGVSQDVRDSLLGKAAGHLKRFISGDPKTPFEFDSFQEIIDKEGVTAESKELIDRILKLRSNTNGSKVTKQEIIKTITDYALTLPLIERNNLLSGLNMGIDDLMVNYVLGRMTKVLNERISSITASQKTAEEMNKKASQSINDALAAVFKS